MSKDEGVLLVISGPAGTGKGTVIADILRKSDEYAYSVSATTRAPRKNEINGLNYHFISMAEFSDHIQKKNVVEYTEYCGNYYGTLRSEVESKLTGSRNLILEIEVYGAQNIKKIYPDSVSVFILTPDYATLERRLRGRGTNTEADIENRLKTAVSEIDCLEQYDYVVFNYDGRSGDAAEEIINIVRSEKRRTKRNRGLAQQFYTKYSQRKPDQTGENE